MAGELYIGLMSGTSLDSVDGVLVNLQKGCSISASVRRAFPQQLRENLLSLCSPGDNEIDRLGTADRQLAELYASAVDELLEHSATDPGQVTAIGCHGQTIRHRPDPERRFTLQIADPNLLAEHTGIAVVADFRRRDMAAGGEGAPLAPAFHAAVFASPTESRAIVNIGGMANISLLCPARPVRGFDTGPGNVLMDGWIQRHLAQAYDNEGGWAHGGQISSNLLLKLLDHPFLALPPPKSTGREDFNLAWLDAVITETGEFLAPQDVQATLLELTATSISSQLRPELQTGDAVFLCGGGANNTALRQRIGDLLPGRTVETTAALGIDPDWVEAAAFAWLAARRVKGLSGNLPEVTGADKAVPLGALYPAG